MEGETAFGGGAESIRGWRMRRLVFKAHRLCVSLNSRLESNKEKERREGLSTPDIRAVRLSGLHRTPYTLHRTPYTAVQLSGLHPTP